MRFIALACDYDGTLARHGRMDGNTVRCLERCIESGRKLLMVTGRELPELIEICSDLNLFEWIVAENGALLYRPATRQEILLGPAPPSEFVRELQNRGVERISIGRVIVATWEPHETTVLETIRDLGLEMQVIFNKGAVMVLPSGINKATGLQKVLSEMGLSSHNVVSVGDAENDHALLAVSEAGIAVANAVPMLKEHADLVTQQTHGAGVGEIIEQLIDTDLSEIEPKLSRHSVLLGQAGNGKEFCLHPFRPNVLIAGTSGGGKSTVATAMIERLVEKHYQVCVIDPEGDYGEMDDLISIGTAQQLPNVDAVMKLLASPTQSVVVNLLGLPIQDRPQFFLALLARLQELRSRLGRPHWIVVDEAHHVWPTNWAPGELGTSQHLNRTLLITLEPTLLPTTVLNTVDLVLATGKTANTTLEMFATATGLSHPHSELNELDQGAALAWHTRMPGLPMLVEISPARSLRRRHVRKYAEGELEPDRSFYFRGPEGKLNLRAQNLMLFLQLAAGVDDKTWLYHLKAHNYSRWFREAIKDPQLADEAAAVEAASDLTPAETRQRIHSLVEARYTLPASPATPVTNRMASSVERGKSSA